MYFNLLSSIDISLFEQGYVFGMDFLGQFARVIIEGCGIIWLGIIVFTLVLKAITLPFDIYQRVKMRKQNLIMRDMKEDLDKLQKQYANDKTLYNQKMMELYKKNGYSMMGACLPMILSLVILIVAFQGFNAYSRNANLKLFVGMSEDYNAAILKHGVVGPSYGEIYAEKYEGEELEEFLIAKPYRLPSEKDTEETYDQYTLLSWSDGDTWTQNGIVYRIYKEKDTPYMEVRAAEEAGKRTHYLYYIYNLKSDVINEEYQIDVEILCESEPEEIDAIVKTLKEDEAYYGLSDEAILKEASKQYVVRTGANAAKDFYENTFSKENSFIWVKNVWYPDVAWSHPVPSYSTFKSQLGSVKVTMQYGEKKGETKKVSEIFEKDPYNDELTSQLTDNAMKKPNGYFILVLLSIGTMVLSQFLTMRSQKETNQYQSVDGQAAKTQKMMLIMMPLIYAVFAFMYSAAFSIYMTVSSVITLAVTLLSNYFIGKAFKKKETTKIKEQYGRTLSWKKPEAKKGKKKK